TPATNQTGTAMITICALDTEFGAVSNSFLLTVTPINHPPRISTVPNQAGSEDAGPLTVLFTVDDLETPAGNLTVVAHSSNQALITDAALRLGGSGTNRALLITTATNQNGAATITLTASDGLTNTSKSFL